MEKNIETIKRLKSETGAGIAECKKALEATKGNYKQALNNLKGNKNNKEKIKFGYDEEHTISFTTGGYVYNNIKLFVDEMGNCSFRTIRILDEEVEILDSEIKKKEFGLTTEVQTRQQLTTYYDSNSIQSHEVKLEQIKVPLFNKIMIKIISLITWLLGSFFALVIPFIVIFFLSAIFFGGKAYYITPILFVVIILFVGISGSLSSFYTYILKCEVKKIVESRGEGWWTVVPENRWNRFSRKLN